MVWLRLLVRVNGDLLSVLCDMLTSLIDEAEIKTGNPAIIYILPWPGPLTGWAHALLPDKMVPIFASVKRE